MTVTLPTGPSGASLDEVTVRAVETLDISTLQAFWTQLTEAAARNPARLVVDLTDCRYLDAQAIRLLLDIHELLWVQRARLVLVGARPEVVRLLAIAGVLNVFTLERLVPEQVTG